MSLRMMNSDGTSRILSGGTYFPLFDDIGYSEVGAMTQRAIKNILKIFMKH